MDGFYSLPAGHVDGHEAAVVAACREAREETGVEVQPEGLRLRHTVHELAEGHERLNLGFEVLRYKGKITNTEPKKCDELRWVPLDDLPEKMVPSVRDMLERIHRGEPYSDFNF